MFQEGSSTTSHQQKPRGLHLPTWLPPWSRAATLGIALQHFSKINTVCRGLLNEGIKCRVAR